MAALSKIKIISPTHYDRQLPPEKFPRNNTDFWIGYFPNIPCLRVCWFSLARLQVLRHAYQTPNIEVGGILVGNVYRSNDMWENNLPVDFIKIVYTIPAAQYTRESAEFNFRAETWAEMNLTLDHMKAEGSLPENIEIIGWYHTHPGHGISLSRRDLFIHNNYFSRDFQLALVIETKKHEGAFYVDNENKGGPYKSEPFTWDMRFLTYQGTPISSDAVAGNTLEQPSIQISDSETKNNFTQPETADVQINILSSFSPKHGSFPLLVGSGIVLLFCTFLLILFIFLRAFPMVFCLAPVFAIAFSIFLWQSITVMGKSVNAQT